MPLIYQNQPDDPVAGTGIFLQDSNGVIWLVGVDSFGRLTTIPAMGTPSTPVLNDSSNVSWQVGITTGGELTTTSITAGSYPVSIWITGSWYLGVNTSGKLTDATAQFEDSESWWGGVQQCFASVAIAVVVSATALSTAASIAQYKNDDIPAAGSLYGPVDEDYWQNRVAPNQISNVYPQQWQFYSQDPAANFDEDLWLQLVPPENWDYGSLYLPDPDQSPPAPVTFQPDEDFWINPVAPVEWDYGSLYLPDPEELSAGHLFGQYDEDFWQNPVSALVWHYGSLYLPDPEEIPAAMLFGQPDEDLWQNPVRPIIAANYQPLPYLFDIGEIIPQGFINPDEDLWHNPTPPAVWPNVYPQPWTFDIQEPAGNLYHLLEEDVWRNPVLPAVSTNIVASIWSYDSQEIAPVLSILDEDFWTNPIPPAVWANQYPQPFSFDTQEIETPPSLNFDEECWQNRVAPVQTANYQPLPYSFPQDEIATGILPLFVPDEDFWINPVAPIWGPSPLLYFYDSDYVENQGWLEAVAMQIIPDLIAGNMRGGES